MAVPLDAYLKAIAAVVCGSFALVVLSGAPRRRPAQLLSVFLALIAANQGFEVMRALASEDSDRFFWFRLATLAASLDPFVLAWFVSKVPGGERLHRGPFLYVLLAASGGFALYTAFGMSALPDVADVFPNLLITYTVAVYVLLAVELVAAQTVGPRTKALQVGALLIAAFPLSAAFSEPVLAWLQVPIPAPFKSVVVLGFDIGLVLALGGIVFAAGRRTGLSSSVLTRALLLGLSVWAIVNSFHVVRGVGSLFGIVADPGLVVIGRSGAPLRWLLFSVLFSIVLVRNDEFGIGLRARRRAARVFISLVVLSVSALLVANVETFTGSVVRGIDILLVMVAAVLSQGFRGFVDWTAHRLYDVPQPGDVAARHEAYRIAVLQAFASGREPAGDEGLATLRDDLEIDAATARAIENIAEATSDAPLVPGQVVMRRYRIVQVLGRGGAGRAFLATDLLLGRDIAIKEIAHDDGAPPSLDEARVAGAIQHAHVVRVYDLVERPASTLLITEYVSGGSLQQRLDRDGPLGLDEGVHVLRGVLEGLAVVHERGVVHRDLKPANILLDAAGEPKIADFGVAFTRPVTQVVGSASGYVIGTVGFMAPEQARSESPRPASDLYSVGMIARVAVQGPWPPELESFVNWCTEEDPLARPQDAAAALAAFLEAVQAP